MTPLLTLILPTVVATTLGLWALGVAVAGDERRHRKRVERLNEESWEVLEASRRIHDQTAEAFQALFDEARQQTMLSATTGPDACKE